LKLTLKIFVMNNERVKNILEAEIEKMKFFHAEFCLGLCLCPASCIIKKLTIVRFIMIIAGTMIVIGIKL